MITVNMTKKTAVEHISTMVEHNLNNFVLVEREIGIGFSSDVKKYFLSKEDTDFTILYMPETEPMDLFWVLSNRDKSKKTVLFLDEVERCYSDGGELIDLFHHIPKNVYVIATKNPDRDDDFFPKSNFFEMILSKIKII